jgi:hypothetical protein
MAPEILALLDKPHLLIAVLFAGAVIGMSVEQWLSKRRRRAWRDAKRLDWAKRRAVAVMPETGRGPVPRREPNAPTDPADQLRIVMAADFTIQPLLNRSEARVFRELDRFVIACNPGWQVMAQVSLGEILRCHDAGAYGCINAKRVDLLLVDEACRPRHAVEYQGGGHHQAKAAARDAVKKEALRRAGIGYHEVVAGLTTPADLKRLVARLVDRPPAPSMSSVPPARLEPLPPADAKAPAARGS